MSGDGDRRGIGRRAGRLLAVGAPAGAAAVALTAWATARVITTPGPRERKFITPWELGISHEEVSFSTEDDITLSSWWLPKADAERTVIFLHGHRGARHHSLGIGAALWKRGANVLLFDYRGRGYSEGNFMSLGHFELLDTSAAIEYTVSKAPDVPLGLLGYSMGAAVAIMAAARDERIGAVVADSSFASERGLIRGLLKRRVGPLELPVAALAENFLLYNAGEMQPIKAVGNIAPGATLFIHGLEDKTCAAQDSMKLHEAAGDPKDLWLLDGVGHCDAYFVDRPAYCERVASFFEEHLSQ